MSINEKLLSVLLVLLICLAATEVGRRAAMSLGTKCAVVKGYAVSRTVLNMSSDTFTCHYEKSK